MKHSTSIRTQITLLLVGATLLVTVAAGYAVYSDYQLAREEEEGRLHEVVELAAAAIGQFLGDTQQTVVGLAARPSLLTLDPEVCGDFLREVNPVLHPYTNVFVVDSVGDLVCSALPADPETSARGAPWWDIAQRSEGFVVGTPQRGRVSGEPVVVFAHPVRQGGRRIGWVGLSANTVVRFRDLVSRPGIANGIITLAQYDGTVITRSEDAEEWVGQVLPPSEGGEEHSGSLQGTNEAVDGEGVLRFWAYRNLPAYEWRLYAGVPVAAVRTAAIERARPKVLLLLGLLALMLLFATRLQGSISTSLESLQLAVRSAARGRTDTVPVEGPAEVGELAAQFNRTLKDRARALSSERRIRQRYQSILNNAVFGIFISTPDGRLLEANPAFARMLGEDGVGRILTRNMNELYARPADRARLVSEALSGTRNSAEIEWRRGDGSTFPVRLNWTVIKLPDGKDAFEVIAEDMTERRALEQQLRQAQKLEAVGRLAGGVAHDFNNRLTVIAGQAELLLTELPDDNPMRQHAEGIMASSRRAADLTAQLLAFSRRQVARARPLDLARVVEGVDLVLKRLVGEEVEFVMDLVDVGLVQADPGQLEQILLNLCTNARDAMPEGGRITISTETRSLTADAARGRVDAEPGQYGVLVVTDTGQGMDEETRQRVFEPFFTTKPPGKGTGLGLSTVYGITVQSGGHLRVYSWPGKGTRLEVWLPRAVAGAQDVTQPPATRRMRPEPVPGGRETLLVAEDEDPVRHILVTTLMRAGYEVLEAPDGPTALARARDHDGRIHLLVTDVVMPGMRGPELAQRLTRVRPDVGVLFISGYTDQSKLDGGDGVETAFLAKPFTPDELRTVVRSMLDKVGTHPAG